MKSIKTQIRDEIINLLSEVTPDNDNRYDLSNIHLINKEERIPPLPSTILIPDIINIDEEYGSFDASTLTYGIIHIENICDSNPFEYYEDVDSEISQKLNENYSLGDLITDLYVSELFISEIDGLGWCAQCIINCKTLQCKFNPFEKP